MRSDYVGLHALRVITRFLQTGAVLRLAFEGGFFCFAMLAWLEGSNDSAAGFGG